MQKLDCSSSPFEHVDSFDQFVRKVMTSFRNRQASEADIHCENARLEKIALANIREKYLSHRKNNDDDDASLALARQLSVECN